MDTDCIPEGSVVIFTVVLGAAIVTLGAASGPGAAFGHGWFNCLYVLNFVCFNSSFGHGWFICLYVLNFGLL